MERIFFHGLPFRHFIPKFVGNCPCTRQLKLCSLKRNFQVSMETTNFHALKTLFLQVLLGSLLMIKYQLEPRRGLRKKLWTKKVGRRIRIIRIIIIITKKRRNAISLPSGDLIIPWFIILFFLTENQGKILARKQLVAQQNREDARIKKQIETAHKEMARLEKYFNVSAD